MNTLDTLLAFSEWLDSEGFDKVADERTHEQLAKEFIAQWEANPNRSELAGRKSPQLGCATTEQLINELCARASVAKSVGEDWPHYRTVDSE